MAGGAECRDGLVRAQAVGLDCRDQPETRTTVGKSGFRANTNTSAKEKERARRSRKSSKSRRSSVARISTRTDYQGKMRALKSFIAEGDKSR